MPQKNSSIMFTLLGSVFMMMFVASLFHLPSTREANSITSNFLQVGSTGNTYQSDTDILSVILTSSLAE